MKWSKIIRTLVPLLLIHLAIDKLNKTIHTIPKGEAYSLGEKTAEWACRSVLILITYAKLGTYIRKVTDPILDLLNIKQSDGQPASSNAMKRLFTNLRPDWLIGAALSVSVTGFELIKKCSGLARYLIKNASAGALCYGIIAVCSSVYNNASYALSQNLVTNTLLKTTMVGALTGSYLSQYETIKGSFQSTALMACTMLAAAAVGTVLSKSGLDHFMINMIGAVSGAFAGASSLNNSPHSYKIGNVKLSAIAGVFLGFTSGLLLSNPLHKNDIENTLAALTSCAFIIIAKPAFKILAIVNAYTDRLFGPASSGLSTSSQASSTLSNPAPERVDSPRRTDHGVRIMEERTSSRSPYSID